VRPRFSKIIVWRSSPVLLRAPFFNEIPQIARRGRLQDIFA